MDSIIPVFPTAYFPSIAYCRQFFSFSTQEIEGWEHFVKQSIRTRCEILTANGILTLNVPIVHDDKRKPIHELRIAYDKKWILEHWRAIESAYAAAPYFDDYSREIKAILFSKHETLWQLNHSFLVLLHDVLDKPIQFKSTINFQSSSQSDFRSFDFLKREETSFYQQVFGYNQDFIPNLSILDAIMNEGPFCRRVIFS